jgi:hypothetical protein
MFYRSVFVLFLVAIVLPVLLLFTDSEYSFGIFKLFFDNVRILYMYIPCINTWITSILWCIAFIIQHSNIFKSFVAFRNIRFRIGRCFCIVKYDKKRKFLVYHSDDISTPFKVFPGRACLSYRPE